jgi:SAM-dependent methyltransferase
MPVREHRDVKADAERWDARYAGLHTGEPRPPKGLDGIELPNAGLCLDVACGLGAQSMWAALNGNRVVALDVSGTAIKALEAAAEASDVGSAIDARVVDLDAGLPSELSGRCALVICQRFRGAGLYPQLVDAARPGGVIVTTVLSSVGAGTEPGPFHAPVGELLDSFRTLDVEILRSIESDGEATLVARRHSA